MALKKRREKFVTHTQTEEGGTIVTFDRWCCDIDKGDIPANTVKIIIPDDTHIGYITEGAFPKRVVKRLIKSGAVTEYEHGYYLGTDKNPFFILLDFHIASTGTVLVLSMGATRSTPIVRSSVPQKLQIMQLGSVRKGTMPSR